MTEQDRQRLRALRLQIEPHLAAIQALIPKKYLTTLLLRCEGDDEPQFLLSNDKDYESMANAILRAEELPDEPR